MIAMTSPASAATGTGANKLDGHPIVADHRSGVAPLDVAAVSALDGATSVVVTTTPLTGIERTRRVVCLTLAGAEATVDRALARGHRPTAVVVRLVPLGAVR